MTQQESHGTTQDGQEISLFTLRNANGLQVQISEFGALLTSCQVPDKNGRLAEITHGHDTLAGWESDPAFFGATIGRFANRLAEGRFTLDGKTHQLALNDQPGGRPCSLHGGPGGFHKQCWHGELSSTPGQAGVTLTRISPDGEEGFPGRLDLRVSYLLNDENELTFTAEAVSNAPTPINLTNHTYWNLSGDPGSAITDHELRLDASHYLPTDAGLIPTGEIAPVAGTPLDFTRSTRIGERIDAPFSALELAGGYDHAWILPEGSGTRLAARVHHPASGRLMEVLSNQAAIQFYAGNFLGSVRGRGGLTYPHRSAFCLEPEAYPDAPNHPHFPSAILRPGETYRHETIFRFGLA
ncbi:MAG: aldose epimerase family protein [Verrucomicrobiales bacterium]